MDSETKAMFRLMEEQLVLLTENLLWAHDVLQRKIVPEGVAKRMMKDNLREMDRRFRILGVPPR